MKKCICVAMAMLLLVAIAGCINENVENNAVLDKNSETVCSHTYSAATCTKRSQCTKCGYEIGTYGSHSFEDGVCTNCNEEDPNWEPPILTGSEYERVNSLMEGMYQYRLDTGNLVEYHFEDGSFKCYTELGGTILENYGTYTLTEKTLVLFYQNGTVKDCPWKINNNGEMELFLLELD